MSEISQDDLELLVLCAVSYNVRLPYGIVPPRIWGLLSAEKQARLQRDFDERVERDDGKPAARLVDRAESYQRDAGVIRQSGLTDEAVVYETIAAELRKVAEEVGRG